MVTISKTKLELLKKFQRNIEEAAKSLKYYLDEPNVYIHNGKVALVAREIQLQAEAVEQYLFPGTEFKVTDDTTPAETSKLLGVLQVDDVEEVDGG